MLENEIRTQKDPLRAKVLSYIYQVTVTANRRHKKCLKQYAGLTCVHANAAYYIRLAI